MCSVLVEAVFLFAFVSACISALNVDEMYSQNSGTSCLSPDYKFRVFIGTSIKDCIKECAVRPMCQAVNYHKNALFCELLRQDIGEVFQHASQCVMIKKSEIELTLPTDCDQCTEGDTCETDEFSESGTCVIKECKPLTMSNGHILGNMNAIDSRLVYKCDRCYRRSKDVVFSVCLPDGSWSGDPDCIQGHPPAAFCPGIVLNDGTTYPLGFPESTNYFGGSCYPSSSYCHGNGTWESIPACDRPAIAHYLGCYADCPDRLLNTTIPLTQFQPATTDNCIAICSSSGFNFAFTEASAWCFCGNEVLHFTKVDESDCNYPCKDNSNQMCGGYWRSSLYDLTIQTGNYGCINTENKCPIDYGINAASTNTAP